MPWGTEGLGCDGYMPQFEAYKIVNYKQIHLYFTCLQIEARVDTGEYVCTSGCRNG